MALGPLEAGSLLLQLIVLRLWLLWDVPVFEVDPGLPGFVDPVLHQVQVWQLELVADSDGLLAVWRLWANRLALAFKVHRVHVLALNGLVSVDLGVVRL